MNGNRSLGNASTWVLVAAILLAGFGPAAGAPAALGDNTPQRSLAGQLQPAACQEWLSNGDFERGTLALWNSGGPAGLGPGRNSAHGAWLGGEDGVTAGLHHPLILPPEATEITLTFWWLADAALEQPGDVLTAGITFEEVFTPLLTLPAAAPIGAWQQATVNLSDYAGKVVAPSFVATTDAATPTTFRLDDVSLSVCGVPPSDLTVPVVARGEGQICYVLHNAGEGMAPKGHQVELWVDGSFAAAEWEDAELFAGARRWNCFDYEWVCAPSSDEVTVRADRQEWVSEADETNNERSELWWCDSTPPVILSGPEVSGITTDSAVVSWETDEASDSAVRYGQTARILPLQASDAAVVTAHGVTLTGLEASATYQLRAESADASGNRVESALLSFQTLAAADSQAPTVTLRDPGVCRGMVKIVADAADNRRVDRVEFYLVDGLAHAEERAVAYIDYESPYEWWLQTEALANGSTTVAAAAYDAAGLRGEHQLPITIDNPVDMEGPLVTITAPEPYEQLSGYAYVTVEASDDVGVCSLSLYVDAVKVSGRAFHHCPLSVTEQLGWDTEEVSDGEHDVAVEARDDQDKPGYDLVTVKTFNPPIGPIPGRPNLSVTALEVLQYGTVFAIEMTVKNAGLAKAERIEIQNWMQGFQPLAATTTTPETASNTIAYDPTTYWAQCETQERTAGIAAGASTTYTCWAVPLLIESGKKAPPTPSIGDQIYLSYKGPDGTYTESASMPVFYTTQRPDSEPMATLADAHASAVAQSDYLIVTNPTLLQAAIGKNPDNLMTVLGAMADLAFHKWGVLGYLDDTTAAGLLSLIAPKGGWAEDFKDGFYPSGSKLGGYLLIVGETEVIPAWDFNWEGTLIEYSDQAYADAGYSWIKPVLIVSRIIGNDTSSLTTALTNATTYGAESGRSNALLVSGTGSGQDGFVEDVNYIDTLLQDSGFSVDKVHWKDYDTAAEQRTAFKQLTPGQDLIFFRDHGGVDSWDDALETHANGHFPLNLNIAHPFVLACCCLTGDYESGNDANIAEAFFASGASLYIGSTEISYNSVNSSGCEGFFVAWTDSSQPERSVAEAFTLLERLKSGGGDDWERWVIMYNIYGDPKLGKAVTKPAAAAAEALPAPPSSPSPLTIEVPDYEVTTVNGKDRARIPGGQIWLVADQPQIPYYTVEVDYPPGTRIQGVTLVERSGLSTATGLDLPLASMEPGNANPSGSAGGLASAAAGIADASDGLWLPGEEFNWRVVDHPDNSVALVLSVYAFHYNPFSTDVQFYKNYTFEIEHTPSSVAVTGLATDQFAYAPGEPVQADLELENAVAAQDVVVDAVVRRYLGGEVVGGLLLRTLTGLAGPASFAAEWDGAGVEPGYYLLEVVLRDTAGNELDRERALFRLGISAGEITAFTATPRRFRPGDEIALALQFHNSGTLPIDGRAVIRIWDAAGEVVREFFHDVAVEPGGDVQFDDVWDTAGQALEPYHLVAHVTYDSRACEPWALEVGPWQTYLPLVVRGYPWQAGLRPTPTSPPALLLGPASRLRDRGAGGVGPGRSIPPPSLARTAARPSGRPAACRAWGGPRPRGLQQVAGFRSVDGRAGRQRRAALVILMASIDV
jgi:hypothetical protein